MAALTITIPDEQVSRVLVAFGASLALQNPTRGSAPATAAEVRGALAAHVKHVVLAHERSAAASAAAAAVSPISAA